MTRIGSRSRRASENPKLRARRPPSPFALDIGRPERREPGACGDRVEDRLGLRVDLDAVDDVPPSCHDSFPRWLMVFEARPLRLDVKLKDVLNYAACKRSFEAISNTRRLGKILLGAHLRTETRPGEIASRFDVTWPAVSQSLGVLRRAGSHHRAARVEPPVFTERTRAPLGSPGWALEQMWARGPLPTSNGRCERR